MIISARKTLTASPRDILTHFNGTFDLQFDDGEIIKSTAMELAISRYAWTMLEDYIEAAPDDILITKSYHVSQYMSDSHSFTSKTLLKLMSKIMHDIFDRFMEYDNTDQIHFFQDNLWEHVLQINNDLFNDITIYGQQYHLTLNIEDILEIMYHPEILKIKKDYPINQETIKNPDYIHIIYKKKQKVIESNALAHNNVHKMMKCGVVKTQQLMQCIGPRGSVTDMNSDIFNEPIAVGYLDGFSRVYDTLIESRTAAMSLNSQSTSIKFTEYFSRRVQFVGMELKNVHFTDCGTRHHLEFQVRTDRQGYAINDLALLEGMYYLDEETNQYRVIHKDSGHLIGKRIKLRTVLGCQHKDPEGVCAVCFGSNARNIPRYRNVGHFCIITFTRMMTQAVLSTKHLTTSASAEVLVLTEYAKRFLTEINDGLAVKLNADLKNQYSSIKLSISEETIEGLSDIVGVVNVGVLSAKRTSKVNRISLIFTDKEGRVLPAEVLDVVPVRDEGYLSMAVLQHMKKEGWHVTDDGYIQIELIGFDDQLPIIEITPKQSNMFRYAKGLERLIKSSVKDIRMRATSITPEAFLMELSDEVNQKIGINLSILQVIAYTMLAVDVNGKDYSLPKPWTKHGVGTMDHLLRGRSLSAALAYEKQGLTLSSPSSFRYTNRTDSPMDEFFTPQDMDLEYHKLDITQ